MNEFYSLNKKLSIKHKKLSAKFENSRAKIEKLFLSP